MNINEVVIIGAGPAGLSTVIQLKRYGIEPILLEKEEIGGLLRNANLVENYPGFPEGITGPKLIKLFKKQLKNTMVKVHFEEVLELDYRNEVFFVNTNQRVVTCCIAVIASGTKPCRLSNLNISTDIADRIFYEIYPLTKVAKEKIAIIGSGDIAFDYALNLSKKNGVIILNKGKRVKCLPLLWERAMGSEKISYKENTQVKKIKYHDEGLILTGYNTRGEWSMYVSCLVVAIGREPYLDFLSDNIKKNLEELQKTKMLYMIGDVKNDIHRQTAIAVGDGIKSAMEIHRKIKEKELCG